MTDKTDKPILNALVTMAVLATLVNAVVCAHLGIGDLFLSICEQTSVSIGILWFASAALLLFVTFMVVVQACLRIMFLGIDGIDRTRVRKPG